MRLFVQGDQLPHGRMAIAIAQGIQSHLDAVVAQQGIVVQQLEDIHQDVDGDPSGNRSVHTRPRRQTQQAEGVEPAVPIIDDRGLDRQQSGHAPRAKADLQQVDNPPAGLLFCWVFAIGPKP